jgi:ABC-type antimicrobial peptide transport system permease subunit
VMRYVGFSLGSALSATVLEAATPTGAAFPPSSGYSTIAWVGVGTCVAVGLLTSLLPSRRALRPEPVREPSAAEAADVAAAPHDPTAR